MAFTKFHNAFWDENVGFVLNSDLLHESNKYMVRSGVNFWLAHKLHDIADKGVDERVCNEVAADINSATTSYRNRFNNFEKYAQMTKFSKIYRIYLFFLVWLISSDTLGAPNSKVRSIGEMHPPVVVSIQNAKLVVLFLKNNRRSDISGHVADGEIFYFQFRPYRAKLKYVWKVEGREIVSVFSHSYDVGEVNEQFLYILTRTLVDDPARQGYDYSTMKLSVMHRDNDAEISFFERDFRDPNLENCFEGTYVGGAESYCMLKDARGIKKYLDNRQS